MICLTISAGRTDHQLSFEAHRLWLAHLRNDLGTSFTFVADKSESRLYGWRS